MSLNLSRHQRNAYRLALAVAVLAAIVVFLPAARPWAVPGPHNTGHADLDCGECHADAPGTARQQIQANVRHWLDLRADPAPFSTLPVDSENCLDCHNNEADLHPIYRFNEPRFVTVREAIGAHRCTSCHRQHEGVRVTMALEDCRYCHEDTALKNDPLDVSHAALVADERWETCLGCHDFHGNHQFEEPTRLDDAFSVEAVETYLQGGHSPYGSRQATVIDTMRTER